MNKYKNTKKRNNRKSKSLKKSKSKLKGGLKTIENIQKLYHSEQDKKNIFKINKDFNKINNQIKTLDNLKIQDTLETQDSLETQKTGFYNFHDNLKKNIEFNYSNKTNELNEEIKKEIELTKQFISKFSN